MSALAVFVHALRSLLSFLSRLLWPDGPAPRVQGSDEFVHHVRRRSQIRCDGADTLTGRAQQPRTRPAPSPLLPPATPPAVRRVAPPKATLDPAAVNVTGQVVEGTKVIERLLLQIVAAASPSDVPLPTGGIVNTLGYLMEQTKGIVKQHQRKVKRPALFKMLARVRDIRNHAVHTHGSTEPAEVDLPEFLNCFNACHRGLSDILGLLVKQGST